jgi:adenine-specific DNA-methyltransferase
LKKDYHPSYYLALLNSDALTFFLKETGTGLRGGYFTMKTDYLNPFPIPEIDSNDKNRTHTYKNIIGSVDEIIDCQKRMMKISNIEERERLQNRVVEVENQIQIMIFSLYGLDHEEIITISESVRGRMNWRYLS